MSAVMLSLERKLKGLVHTKFNGKRMVHPNAPVKNNHSIQHNVKGDRHGAQFCERKTQKKE
jgi:hypothetical protein